MKTDEKLGLSSYDSLDTLHADVLRVLTDHEAKEGPSKWSSLRDILSPKNELSTFNWISVGCILFAGLSLIFTSFFVDSLLYGDLIRHGVFIIGIGAVNLFLVGWDHKLRQNEIPERLRGLLQLIIECRDRCSWAPEHYPHLCSPYSPCITLQWTYRDGRLVNLPWALLCKGDTIVLRPGQTAPGNCFQLDNSATFLACGEVYSPPQKHDQISVPTARIPFSNKRFVLQETPLLRNITEVLESTSKVNLSCYDRKRHMIMSTVIQCFVLPLFFFITLMVNVLRLVYIDEWVESDHWSVMIFLLPVLVCVPILPFSFPFTWILLHTYGNAKLSAFLQSNASNPKTQPHNANSGDPFEDISIVDDEVQDIGAGVKWGQHILHSLFGKQHSLALTRSVNPLHVLGSVTALSCVDKKGILSWPNPTAEKIFLLKSTTGKQGLSRNATMEQDVAEVEEIEMDPPVVNERKTSKQSELTTSVEVLDLTHDLSCPFKLEFDDTRWQEHINSLKPIGLAILLNTCNLATQEHYVQFCSHVTCEALYNEDLVPVTNRRCPPCVKEVTTLQSINTCLCELSKQIGFTENAKNNFTLLEQLSTFRHVQPETVRRDIKFARSLALATKLKLPFPHMVAVVTAESNSSQSLQLFSQATGDIALDSCIDFWDGNTLKTLTPSDRKKILDFYQRTSLTAYCTAFAYRPLGKSINSKLSRVYMELPADSHSLYLRNRSPTPLDWDLHQSSDSLYGMEGINGEVADIEGCFEIQCNQIFLGMVTMQYQAQIEMVQLIEQLERACIRFVHFSKENELRSRVFSEKMGLESGWNCHISLLSGDSTVDDAAVDGEMTSNEDLADQTVESPLLDHTVRGSLEGSRTMSVSAPCAMNASGKDVNGSCSKQDDDDLGSQEGWQSLSCLTDSTEQSAPINFDMSNRAKLPRGIERIRPHLEQVDNVPLLVSLFTDCTPSTTQQMIGIMQEYGEVVCVIGSSANADNSSIFLKADASISVEPLYPQVCQKVPVFTPTTDGLSPAHLSLRLNSLPCSVTIMRQRPVSLFHLIMHARHFMQSLWNCIQFWGCGVVALSLLQVFNTLLMLPPLFTIGQIIWMSCFVVPLLAISLVHSPTSPQVMQRPGSRNQFVLNIEMIIFVLWCYGSKFLPSLLIVPLVFGATLNSYCLSVNSRGNGTCSSFVYPSANETWGGWGQHRSLYSEAQVFASSLFVLHLGLVSVGFVHREYLCWRRSPFRNKLWVAAIAFLCFIQVLYLISPFLFSDRESSTLETPWIAVAFSLASPFIVSIFNEFVKWQEIKSNLRYEKRARLDFGTKLGMNSPF